MRDWENLRYFMAVARNGTVSGAAKELVVSHSTVLRRIEQFEKMLDSKLFKRLQRGYALTIAGEKLYNDGKGVFESKVDKRPFTWNRAEKERLEIPRVAYVVWPRFYGSPVSFS